jgi:pimeloyl-ACP methyl ester carboxylesterase
VTDVERIAVKTPTSGTLSVGRVGTGPSLILLHRSIGGDSAGPLVEDLSARFTVLAPSLPGFDDSDCPDWARSPRDLAAIVLHSVGPLLADRPVLVGLGLGGWVAAEIAATSPERLRALVLVGPLGVQPMIGEITDPFLVSTERYVELGFANKENYEHSFAGGAYELGSESWLRRERNREMTTRIAWRPRMFDATLPFRLAYVTTPTLIAWGELDAIVPRDAVDRYRDAIPGAELITMPDRGHMLECEAPGEVGQVISSFATRRG